MIPFRKPRELGILITLYTCVSGAMLDNVINDLLNSLHSLHIRFLLPWSGLHGHYM